MPSSRRTFLLGAGSAACVGLSGCSALDEPRYSPGEATDAEWPQAGHDAGSTGFSPDAAAPRDGATRRWRTAVARPSDRPVVAGGTVYVPTMTELLALDAETGAVRWRFGDEQPWPTAPAVHDGTLYLGFRDARDLVALDAADGSERWRVGTRGDLQAPPVLDRDARRLVAGDDTGRVYQVDPASGERRHVVDVFGEVTALAMEPSLLVGTSSGEVSAFYEHRDVLTGLWRRRLAGSVTDLAVADGAAFAATFGGPVYRLAGGAHAGTSQWEYDRGSVHLAATPADVVGTDLAGLRVLDDRTGEEKWRYGGSYGCAPAVAGDTIYAGGSHGVTALAVPGGVGVGDLRFGAERWTHGTETGVIEGLAVADGAVFGVTAGGESSPPRAFALDPA